MAINRHGKFGQFRMSAAEASLQKVLSTPGVRPPPPKDLTEAEAAHWRIYVEAMPAGWFTPEKEPVLKELCRHVVCSEGIHEEVKRLRDVDGNIENFPEFLDIMKAQAVETRFVVDLSGKLRLTHKAQPIAEAKEKLDAPIRPWEQQGKEREEDGGKRAAAI